MRLYVMMQLPNKYQEMCSTLIDRNMSFVCFYCRKQQDDASVEKPLCDISHVMESDDSSYLLRFTQLQCFLMILDYDQIFYVI